VTEISPHLYEVKIKPAWHGHVTVTLPATPGFRANVIVHKTGGGWQIESQALGRLTVDVSRLSVFTTVDRLTGSRTWAACSSALASPLHNRRPAAVENAVGCLEGIGVSRISSGLANRFLTGALDLGQCAPPRYLDLAQVRCVGDRWPARFPRRVPAGPTESPKPPPTKVTAPAQAAPASPAALASPAPPSPAPKEQVPAAPAQLEQPPGEEPALPTEEPPPP
jgi:hypothetical protein